MKQQHGKYDVKKYDKGINSDISKELMGDEGKGHHVDTLNMRSFSQDGTNEGLKHIGGEGTIFPALDNKFNVNNPIAINDFTPYHCMMSQSINNKVIEIWCSENNISINPSQSEPSFIRIDGVIYLMSFDFPIYYDKPLQYDKNQHVLGGEFYITDFYSEPMIFNVQDLIDASDSTNVNFDPLKYFSEFNYIQYTITIQSSLYKPQFIDLVNSAPEGASVIGSSGLPVGQYSYAYRYVSSGGDFSSLSPLSDLIPVVKTINKRPLFNQASISANPDITAGSLYNPYLKIRYVNDNQFASIQIIRHCWTTGASLDSQPISYIIHTKDISKTVGVGVFSFFDLQNDKAAMQSISYEESNVDVTSIKTAKSIRFYNRRLYLMNLKYKSKVTDSILNLSGDNYLFPTIQKINHEGHSNIYNAATYKSYMRGERQSFGVLLYDNNGSATYVCPIPTAKLNNSYQHPNRRVKLSAESKGSSYEGAVTATPENNGDAVLTHEVFDHERASGRGGFLNYDIHGANVSASIIHPVNQADTSFQFQRPNISVGDDKDATHEYDPKCFDLDYYSLGIAVKNIKIPSGFSGFSIVKTEPAKRVLAQGIAMYDFSTSYYCNVYFPDLYNLDTTTLIQLINGGADSYQLEIVSSLGFFSEIYSGVDLFNSNQWASHGLDMITFSRILKEQGDINPTVGNGHVKYDQWKRVSSVNLNDKIFNIVSPIQDMTTDSGKAGYLRIQLSKDIYDTNTALHGTTPMYIVNLIKKDKDVSDSSIMEYTSTGHFQKAESTIGNVTKSGKQSFSLISERWEDCINKPFKDAQGTFNNYVTLEKYIYIRENKIDKAWINVTYKSDSQINYILNQIVSNGYYQSGTDPMAYGVYKDNSISIVNSEPLQRDYNIIFEQFNLAYNTALFIPNIGSDIIVKYDDRIPTRVFGGDTFVNECIWAFQDNRFDALGNPLTSFALNRQFPYTSYQKAPNMIQYGRNTRPYVFLTDSTGLTTVSSNRIRQLINMYTAETRSPLCFSFEESPSVLNDLAKFYPLKNYVPRPYVWDTSNPSASVHDIYGATYGHEWDYWQFGGFKYIQTINQDNVNRNNAKLLTSVPKLGFTEQTNYPTRIAWSDKKAVNQQNTPGIKTFYTKSIWDISDNNGEIKFAWSAHSNGQGQNLYAITSNGIALVLVDKRVINDANAQQLFSGSAIDEGVVNELWLNQSIGMNDEYWRSWAEYNNVLFFCSKTGVYALTGNQLEFLSEQNGFQEIYKNRVTPYIGEGLTTKLSGVFNILNKEYIMNFDISNVDIYDPQKDLIPSCLIYGVEQQALQCRASYDYDKYLSLYNKLYAMRKGVTYELGLGNYIDGIAMIASATNVSSGKKGRFEADVLYQSKEFIRIRVNSNHKPNRILFFDDYKNYINSVVSSVVDSDAISYSIKDYGGYECYIPRKLLAPHLRQQGRLVIFRVENNINEDFTINATMVQFKVLK